MVFKRLYKWDKAKDQQNGKVKLLQSENEELQPDSNFSENDDDFVESVDTAVHYAQSGDLSCSIEAILALSHCLKNNWTIPKSLADYMSEALQNAAIKYGQTEGKAEQKYHALAKALNLTKPKGKPQDFYRDFYIHNYIKNRMELLGESKYMAAKHAEKAFKGSEFSTEHDTLETIFDRYENEVGGGSPEGPEVLIFLYAGPEFCPIGMVFNDSEFLNKTIPYLGDDPMKFHEDFGRNFQSLFKK